MQDQKSCGRSVRMLAAAGVAALLFLASGCGVYFHTPQSRVKRELKRFCGAMSVEEYQRAAITLDESFRWTTEDVKLQGQPAVKAFFAGFMEMKAKRAFYATITEIKKIDETKLITFVDCRQETTEGMVGLRNLLWKAQINWVKKEGRWRIVEFRELTPREWRQTK